MVRTIIYFLLSLICFTSCYEPVDGCLDPDAENYNVTADNDCSGCCQLPQVRIVFTYLYNGNSFNLGDTLSVGSELIKLNDFHFYLSNISVVNDAGGNIYLEDSVRIEEASGSVYFVGDNYRYFDRQRFSANLDGLRYSGTLTSIEFDVGIPESYNLYNPDSLRINSMLGTIPTDAYIEGSGFIFFSFDVEFIQRDVQSIDMINSFPLTTVSLNLDGINVERAKDVSISLIFDVGTAVSGISGDFSADENGMVVKNNIGMAFSQKI